MDLIRQNWIPLLIIKFFLWSVLPWCSFSSALIHSSKNKEMFSFTWLIYLTFTFTFNFFLLFSVLHFSLILNWFRLWSGNEENDLWFNLFYIPPNKPTHKNRPFYLWHTRLHHTRSTPVSHAVISISKIQCQLITLESWVRWLVFVDWYKHAINISNWTKVFIWPDVANLKKTNYFSSLNKEDC